MKTFIYELEWVLISPQLTQVSVLEEIINGKLYNVKTKYEIKPSREDGQAITRLVEKLSPTEKKAATRSREEANHIVNQNTKKK